MKVTLPPVANSATLVVSWSKHFVLKSFSCVIVASSKVRWPMLPTFNETAKVNVRVKQCIPVISLAVTPQ